MNRQSSRGYQLARALVPAVLAHGPTPEQLVAAEMHLASLRLSLQLPLFDTVPPNAGLITGGQPEPTGLAETASVGL
ncbi:MULTISPECIES: hypothetical protein [Luteibacter]|uniref:hypothetical protein n=1 Tax=Luteibacter TaxID=242605 RepID=UPI00055D703A|nr:MULTISPECIES: hypothetical protein [unclassified Luteibacter]